jgi:putative membrane protein
MKTRLLKIVSYNVLGVLCLLASASVMATEDHGKLTADDYKFVTDAASGGLAQVQLGQIARDRASDPGVKKFADKMIKENSDANQQLTQLASQKGVTLPTDIPVSEKKETDRLLKLSGPDFDHAYMKHVMRDHKKDIKTFQRESEKASDADVQSWATKTLPTLKEHLDMAQDINANVKGESPSIK